MAYILEHTHNVFIVFLAWIIEKFSHQKYLMLTHLAGEGSHFPQQTSIYDISSFLKVKCGFFFFYFFFPSPRLRFNFYFFFLKKKNKPKEKYFHSFCFLSVFFPGRRKFFSSKKDALPTLSPPHFHRICGNLLDRRISLSSPVIASPFLCNFYNRNYVYTRLELADKCTAAAASRP